MTASDMIAALRGASPAELREIAEVLFMPLQAVPIEVRSMPSGGSEISTGADVQGDRRTLKYDQFGRLSAESCG